MASPVPVDDHTHRRWGWWLVVGALVVIGAVTVVRWVIGALTGLLGLALLVLVVVAAVSIIRFAWRARR